jgi:hypothetical protein
MILLLTESGYGCADQGRTRVTARPLDQNRDGLHSCTLVPPDRRCQCVVILGHAALNSMAGFSHSVQHRSHPVSDTYSYGSEAQRPCDPFPTARVPPNMAARIYVKELEKQLQHGRPMYDLECDVNIGDVGFFADDTGDFCSLFNVLLDASHPVHAERGVPRGFQPLVVSRQDWKFKSNYFPVTAMGSKTVTSMDIDVHAESG